jgi:RNAse (barnase) inhibitor barstar
MTKAVYEIDGRDFTTLQGFYEVVSRVLIPGAEWGHNLDAFNDILHGGFGTPDGGFVLRWVNAAVSRERLGYPETVKQLERRLSRCHPLNRESVGGTWTRRGGAWARPCSTGWLRSSKFIVRAARSRRTALSLSSRS